jgi:hypothetical protein
MGINMKKTVLLVIVLVFCVNFLQAQSGKWANVVFSGENERILEGSTWQFNEQGGIRFEFRRGGKLVLSVSSFNNKASWERVGDTVKLVYLDGQVFIEGVYYPESQKILGTRYTTHGSSDDITLVPEGSFGQNFVADSGTGGTAQSSTTPSTQNRNSSPNIAQQLQQAFQSPLDNGTYGLAGTKATIRLTAIAKNGIFTYTNKQGGTGTGNYQIEGNRMTIQMEGYTFVYNVTSRTSFSGNGETWVRTGY